MSQFVWTCKACGWRTTAENAALGIRGAAPAACRRCSKASFNITSEKHPKVTLVCKAPDCRADFAGTWGTKYCQKCRAHSRLMKSWEGRRKYVWTPERDQILKDHYKNNPTDIAARFFPGWPKYAIAHRAQDLGLCRVKEKPWTKAEDAFLLEHAGTRTPKWMAKQLMRRTPTAVVVRLKRLHVSRRIQSDGLTMGQLEQAIGVDHRQIAGWWRSGRLKGIRRDTDRLPQQGGDPYVFNEAEVARFLLDNPSAFRLDRVNQSWFMALMRDASGAARTTASKSSPTQKEDRPTKTLKRVVTAAAVPDSMTACVGVAEKTPCPHQKQVAARQHIPARCPDCKLEFKRRLHREESERMQRIRASSPPQRATA